MAICHTFPSSSSSSLLMMLLIHLIILSCLRVVTASAVQLESNQYGSPMILSDVTDVCTSAQGRTSMCKVELDVPPSCSNNEAYTSYCPIVFFFHGAFGKINDFKSNSDVHKKNVIGVYPQGEHNGWNTAPWRNGDGKKCSWDDFDCTKDPDEGAFVAGIISTLRDMGAKGNIYAVGTSMGGFLANRLASNSNEATLPIKGIVTIAAELFKTPLRSGPGDLNSNQPNNNNESTNHLGISVLNIMGTDDYLVPYEGGIPSSPLVFNGDTNFEFYSALDSMRVWSDYNGCDTNNPIIGGDGIRSSRNTGGFGDVAFYRFPNCLNDAVIVEHYAIGGAEHNVGETSIIQNNDSGFVGSISFDLVHDFIQRCEEKQQNTDTTKTNTADDIALSQWW